MTPTDRKYAKTHEWVKIDGNTAVVGITDHAQHEMGDVLFAELPEEGERVDQDEVFGSLESAKTVAELYAPISGEVVSVNKDLEEEPFLINEDPYGNGWLIVLGLDDPHTLGDLLSATEYEEHVEELGKRKRE